MGFESKTVAELREKLVELGVYTEEQVNEIKGKANLVYELTKVGYTPEEENNELIPTSDEIEYEEVDVAGLGCEQEQEDDDENVMEPTDPRWTDYVLEHFTKDELFEVNGKKYPSVAGLRRVSELLMGDFLFSGPVTYNTTHPTPEFPLGSCSVLYEIQVYWKLNMPEYIDKGNFEVKTFRGLAGANASNTDDIFSIYPEAIAETRAEGRALRKLLGLQNIVSYEEITTKNVDEIVKKVKTTEWDGSEKINANQKAAIIAQCEKYGIDLMKFINHGTKQYNSIDEVTKETAAAMIREISRYGQTNDEGKEIPESIKKIVE